MTFETGDIVTLVLHSPREKLLGKLGAINAAGIEIRSIDLGYFDDWCRAIASGEDHLTMSDNFFPMWRVERLSRDEGSADLDSMAQQFERRTGLSLSQQ